MLSPLVLCLLAPDDVPQPNAKRTASGNIVPIASGGGVPCTRGRRGQLKNALYSTAMPGFDWGKWTKWLRPRKDGDARERCASVESSALPGHYTKLLLLYPDVDNEGEKKHRGSVRKGSRLLVNTHRGVRYADGSVGKMVGAGEHASYNGLVEAMRSLLKPQSLSPHPSPQPSHIRSPSRTRRCSHASASVAVRTTWLARWRWPPAASRCLQVS